MTLSLTAPPSNPITGETDSKLVQSLARRKADLLQFKPKLRGWLHAATAPLALAILVVLAVLAPNAPSRIAVIVFGFTALLLFSTSAVYHISNGRISSAVTAILKRVDHANIYLIIAGTYTPLSMLLLPANVARTIMSIVWGGALLGVLIQVFWPKAPRWASAPVYVALGWVAMGFINQFASYGGPVIVSLIIGGGIAYTIGAIVYAIKKPNPSLKWFGFHEVFHTFTILGFASHTVAIFIATLSGRY